MTTFQADSDTEPNTDVHPGDIPPLEFRATMHRVADILADYLENVGKYPVVPKVSPGEIRASLPTAPPQEPEPLARILEEYQGLIEPRKALWL